MLTDLPSWFQGPHCPSRIMHEKFNAENPSWAFPYTEAERIAPGVYVSHLNFESGELSRSGIRADEQPFGFKNIPGEPESERETRLSAYFETMSSLPDDYGVCDSYDQILMRWPQLAADPERQFIIRLTEMTPKNDPDWRWHKWGTYIGTQKSVAERIGDEPEIERVYVYRISEVLEVPDTISIMSQAMTAT